MTVIGDLWWIENLLINWIRQLHTLNKKGILCFFSMKILKLSLNSLIYRSQFTKSLMCRTVNLWKLFSKHFPHYIGESVAADYPPETGRGLRKGGLGRQEQEFRKKDMQFKGQRGPLQGQGKGNRDRQQKLGKNKDRSWIVGKAHHWWEL